MAERVMVALSGGVDSAVTALLLLQAGYQVEGMTIDTGFCQPEQAAGLCEQMGIPFTVMDARDDFKRQVVAAFVDSYATGFTPNPCIQCNIHIKFPYLLAAADRAGCSLVATGHYAQVREGKLFKAQDGAKDQSYVLYGLSRTTLQRLILPLGDLDKGRVRELAAQAGFSNADAPESQDICFVADGDHLSFLHSQGLEDKPGDIVDMRGQVLGTHQGLAAYTIGQRKGLGIGGGEPLFVLEKDVEGNRLVVGTREQQGFSSCTLRDLNWLVDPQDLPSEPLPVLAKVRYRSSASEALFDPVTSTLHFQQPVDALAPGQAAVFYDAGWYREPGRVLGGGTIFTVQHLN